jgi:hypothetical protein
MDSGSDHVDAIMVAPRGVQEPSSAGDPRPPTVGWRRPRKEPLDKNSAQPQKKLVFPHFKGV